MADKQPNTSLDILWSSEQLRQPWEVGRASLPTFHLDTNIN